MDHTNEDAIRAGLDDSGPDGPPAPTVEDSNLVAHARRELGILAEMSATADGDDYDPADTARLHGSLIDAVRAFTTYGHSGGSADWAAWALGELVAYRPLSPLTDDPAEWLDHTTESGTPLWQNLRDSRWFNDEPSTAGAHNVDDPPPPTEWFDGGELPWRAVRNDRDAGYVNVIRRKGPGVVCTLRVDRDAVDGGWLVAEAPDLSDSYRVVGFLADYPAAARVANDRRALFGRDRVMCVPIDLAGGR